MIFSVGVLKEPTKALLMDDAVKAYRWTLEAHLDGRSFERTAIDIGVAESILSEHVEAIKTQPVLVFADIEPTEIRVISLARHIAEKIHAYTHDRGLRENTRIKDLVDLSLLSRMNLAIPATLAHRALVLTFQSQETTIPVEFPLPPESWHSRYASVARGLDVPATLVQAWEEARFLAIPFMEGR